MDIVPLSDGTAAEPSTVTPPVFNPGADSDTSTPEIPSETVAMADASQSAPMIVSPMKIMVNDEPTLVAPTATPEAPVFVSPQPAPASPVGTTTWATPAPDTANEAEVPGGLTAWTMPTSPTIGTDPAPIEPAAPEVAILTPLVAPVVTSWPPANAPKPSMLADIMPPAPTSLAIPDQVSPAPADVSGMPTPVVGQGWPDQAASTPQPLAANGSLRITKRRSLKTLVMVLAAVLLVGGGSAAAYFGMVLPNKPENVLKAALVNSLQSPQVTVKGSIEGSAPSAAYKTVVTASADTAKKAADIQMNIIISGTEVSFEARLIDQNVYLKVGDLTTIVGLIKTFDPNAVPFATAVNSELANQWIEIDSTILKQAGASCVLDSSWSFTKGDLQLLSDQYDKQPFATVKSKTSDSVSGAATDKFVLSVDNDKLAKYSNNLQGLSLFKTTKDCTKGSSSTSVPTTSGDHGQTALTIWVDKAHRRIVKLASNPTAKDAKSGVTGNGTLTLNYDALSIVAPSGAKPALQVITELQTKTAGSGINLSSFITGLSAGGAKTTAH